MPHLTRRDFGRWTSQAAGAVLLGGCAPWESADRESSALALESEPIPTALERRVLNRLGYGPLPGDVLRLRSTSIAEYIDRQLAPASSDESPHLTAALARLETLDGPPEALRDTELQWQGDSVVTPLFAKLAKFPHAPNPFGPTGQTANELAQATILRAAYSTRQLQAVMVEFWTDHFNIDQKKGACRWLKTVDDRGLRQHALGKFRDMLGVSARSPAMLVYLDNVQNRKLDPLTGSGINENFARELLELHSLGDTSAYSLHDIQEVARCFTGWTTDGDGSQGTGVFRFSEVEHDGGEKILLGERIPPSADAAEGEAVLDLLARHPSTARTVVRKLCSRFLGISDPPQLTEQLVKVFARTDGDLQQVLAVLLHSSEFIERPSVQYKRPFQFTISALRAVGARTSGTGLLPHLEAMGQVPFQWSQPDGYPTRIEPWTSSLPARWRFALALVSQKVDECWFDLESLERVGRRGDGRQLCEHLAQVLVGMPLPKAPEVRSIVEQTATGDPQSLRQWLALLLMSPQFQTR